MKQWTARKLLGVFRRLSRMSRWFETRFTISGRIVAFSAIIATVFGVDTFQTHAYQLSALLVSLVVVSMLASLRWRPQIFVTRALPEVVTNGVATNYDVTITNEGGQAETGLVLLDRLESRYPTVADFFGGSRRVNDRATNWFDRRVGFPRWLAILRFNRGARIEPVAIPTIGAGQSVRVAIPMTSIRRGKIVFDELIIKKPDPLGLFYAIHTFPSYAQCISLPKRHPVPPLAWHSGRHFHRGGVTLATTVGDTEEFIGLRDYRPGDPLRHIHWRSFAKRGEPIVKEHQDEFFDRHALIIDTYAGNAGPAAFEAVVEIAASLIQSERPSDSILDLVFIEQRIWRLTTGRGLSDNQHIMTQIAEIEATSADDFEHVAGYLRRHLDRLSSAILVTASWDQQRAEFVDELTNRHLNVLALCVNDEDDSALDTISAAPAWRLIDIAEVASGLESALTSARARDIPGSA